MKSYFKKIKLQKCTHKSLPFWIFNKILLCIRSNEKFQYLQNTLYL